MAWGMLPYVGIGVALCFKPKLCSWMLLIWRQVFGPGVYKLLVHE